MLYSIPQQGYSCGNKLSSSCACTVSSLWESRIWHWIRTSKGKLLAFTSIYSNCCARLFQVDNNISSLLVSGYRGAICCTGKLVRRCPVAVCMMCLSSEACFIISSHYPYSLWYDFSPDVARR